MIAKTLEKDDAGRDARQRDPWGGERDLPRDEMSLIRELMGRAVAETPLSGDLTEEQMREKLEAFIAGRPEDGRISRATAVPASPR